MSLTTMLRLALEIKGGVNRMPPDMRFFWDEVGPIAIPTKAFRAKSGRAPKQYIARAPYNLGPGTAPTVGNAYDYLTRSMIARKLGHDAEEVWPSGVDSHQERALEHMTIGIASRNMSSDKITAAISDRFFEMREKYARSYIRGANIPIERLVDVSWLAGWLEGIFRCGVGPDDDSALSWLDFETRHDYAAATTDLLRLAEVFEEYFLDPVVKADSKVEYNPMFDSSCLLGGADGDIVVDDILYDNKVTKSLDNLKKPRMQLFCYDMMRRVDSLLSPETVRPFAGVAFFKARHGEIEMLDYSLVDTALVDAAVEAIAEKIRERRGLSSTKAIKTQTAASPNADLRSRLETERAKLDELKRKVLEVKKSADSIFLARDSGVYMHYEP